MLQPVENLARKLTENLPQARECDACHTKIPVGDDAINIMFVAIIGSPGHAAVPPFQCPGEEHWACSVDCWKLVAHACIDEHMLPTLESVHMRLQNGE